MIVAAAILAADVSSVTPATLGSRFVDAVMQTGPLAYYRLTGASGQSEVGSSVYQLRGEARPSSDCAPIGIRDNTCVALNGRGSYFATSLMGGIDSAGSIMAWVRLRQLPSTVNRIFYIAGISEKGNDFDLQFEPDDAIRFYTAAGGDASRVEYAPPPDTLVGSWHMIVATFSSATGSRALYFDGRLANIDTVNGGGTPNKTGPFSIGESTVFHGRYFPGTIADVAVWNFALNERAVRSLYAAARDRGDRF